MLKKSSRSITIPTLNSSTGEVQNRTFTEDIQFKQGKKQGWTTMYKINYDEVMMTLKSDLEKKIFFLIRDSYTKSQTEVSFNKTKIAKKFKSTRPTVSRLFSKLEKIDFLKKTDDGSYRMNPYCYIPCKADGLILQEEWTAL